MSAAHAARELGVARQTIYAYVSRGLLASVADPQNPRARRYPAEGVRRLAAFRAARRDPALGARAAARGALAWGEPVLESAITRIADGRLYYRGHDAAALAEAAATRRTPGGGFERVAELLWRGVLPGSLATDAAPGRLRPLLASLAPTRELLDAATPVQAARIVMSYAEASDPGAGELDPAAVVRVGRDVLALVSTLACGAPYDAAAGPAGGSIAARLANAWAAGPQSLDEAVDLRAVTGLIDAALVLLADHELNVTAFATRVVASAGASPYAALAAGLASLEGTRHAGDNRFEIVLREAESLLEPWTPSGGDDQPAAEPIRAYVARLIRQRGKVPGFRHPLYPDGDPRAALLLRLIRERFGGPGRSRTLAAADALAAAVEEMEGTRPSVDFALVTLCRLIGAPPAAPLALFAVGRTAGLVAHALEQYRTERSLRPRARYVGVPPLDPAPPAPEKRRG
ncbi:MAG TPA: citrate/2-methylcitrate synthase [Longimicrobium sp.]